MTRKKAPRQIKFLLIGLGNVGRRFLELLIHKQDILHNRLGLDLLLVGAADSSGAAICPTGLDLNQIIQLKTKGQSAADYSPWGKPGFTAPEMIESTEAHLLLEASPANMENGQPGLGCIEIALSKGMNVITANKAPLVLAFPRLLALAQAHNVQLRFDATVAGGLPAINLGQRDLAAAEIHHLEGILNLTTNYILTRMAQDDLSYKEALHQAQKAGHAETDPRLDVEGWDAANKLVILAHSVLGYPATLADVTVEGITGITIDELRQATTEGQRVKLIASAKKDGARYHLSVHPTRLKTAHPLAQLGPKQMGIVYHTDISGVISAAIIEETPIPTAAAMLRDLVNIYSS